MLLPNRTEPTARILCEGVPVYSKGEAPEAASAGVLERTGFAALYLWMGITQCSQYLIIAIQVTERSFKDVANSNRQPATGQQIAIRPQRQQGISSGATIRLVVAGEELQCAMLRHFGPAEPTSFSLITGSAHQFQILANLPWSEGLCLWTGSGT